MTHHIGRRTVTVLAAAAMVLLASCGDDDESSSTTDAPADSAAAPAEGGAELTIQGSTFAPLTVAAGEAFTISNRDSFTHTVTSDSFDVTVEGGADETLTIDEPGTYDIHCKIHTSMQSTIVVT